MLGMGFPWTFLRPEAEMHSQISSKGAQAGILRESSGVTAWEELSLLPDSRADHFALPDPAPHIKRPWRCCLVFWARGDEEWLCCEGPAFRAPVKFWK